LNLNLTQPIAFFDLETTGIDIAADRIVEISILKIKPDGEKQIKTHRINPTIPIPSGASKVHGIYDKDVAYKPTFSQLATELNLFLADCDLAGYNSNKFDIPILVEEFLRSGINFNTEGRRFIDVQTIFHKMEQRTLSAAYQFYCEKELVNAHSAEADILATYEILEAQLKRYNNLENDMNFLHDFTTTRKTVDFAGRFIFNEKGEEIFNFGKHKGKTVENVLTTEPSYYSWMMNGDFPLHTKKVITDIKHRMDVKKLQHKFNQTE
jgi:DNA polymerase III subunit epsilon